MRCRKGDEMLSSEKKWAVVACYLRSWLWRMTFVYVMNGLLTEEV